MVDSIQRYPAGLPDLLEMKGGLSPLALAGTLVPIVDLLQFYGLVNRQVLFSTNAAAAEGTAVVVTPSTSSWSILFAASGSMTKTATMTAGRVGVIVTRNFPPGVFVAQDDIGPFGATETGVATIPWVAPYPWLLPPGSTIAAYPAIIGTDATASVTVSCEVGLLF